MGDYSTNAAMLLAPVLGEKPREIAERLGADVGERLGEAATKVEVAGPGFLNLHLTDRWHREAVAAILDAGDAYGRSSPASPERVLVEFVSANPTGPLTVAGGARRRLRGLARAPARGVRVTRSGASTC